MLNVLSNHLVSIDYARDLFKLVYELSILLLYLRCRLLLLLPHRRLQHHGWGWRIQHRRVFSSHTPSHRWRIDTCGSKLRLLVLCNTTLGCETSLNEATVLVFDAIAHHSHLSLEWVLLIETVGAPAATRPYALHFSQGTKTNNETKQGQECEGKAGTRYGQVVGELVCVLGNCVLEYGVGAVVVADVLHHCNVYLPYLLDDQDVYYQ